MCVCVHVDINKYTTYNTFPLFIHHDPSTGECVCVHVDINKYTTYNTFPLFIQHDPTTSECAPSDSNGGRYVMFAHATSGAQRNNDDFSPCSINMMFPIIEDKGQGPGTFN